jgi:hypothetical protein
MIRAPSGVPEQRSDPAVAVPAELSCQVDYVPGQYFLIVGLLTHSTLSRSRLAEQATRSSFRDLESPGNVIYVLAAT